MNELILALLTIQLYCSAIIYFMQAIFLLARYKSDDA